MDIVWGPSVDNHDLHDLRVPARREVVYSWEPYTHKQEQYTHKQEPYTHK